MPEYEHGAEIEKQESEKIQTMRKGSALQLEFAHEMAKLGNISFPEALKKYTMFYRRVAWDESGENPEKWQKFVEEVESADNPADVIVRHLLANRRPTYENEGEPQSSFSYDYYPEKKTIRIHFGNEDTSGLSPLSRERELVRLSELREMFKQIKEKYPDAETVQGGSWLYNLESYRRLFPPEYGESRTEHKDRFNAGMGIWGQFLDKEGKFKQDLADEFLTKLHKAKTPVEAAESFHYKRMNAICPIEKFYEFYGIE